MVILLQVVLVADDDLPGKLSEGGRLAVPLDPKQTSGVHRLSLSRGCATVRVGLTWYSAHSQARKIPASHSYIVNSNKHSHASAARLSHCAVPRKIPVIPVRIRVITSSLVGHAAPA